VLHYVDPETHGTAARRFLRDTCGFSQEFSQNTGDVLRYGEETAALVLAFGAGGAKKVAITAAKTGETAATVAESAAAANKAARVAQFEKGALESWQVRKSKIHGKAQKTGTEGHDWQSMREAVKATKDPNVVRVHMDQSLSKVTEGKVASKMRPDVTTVRKDGKIITDEIPSKSQSRRQMEKKIEKMQNLLPPEMRGPKEGGRVLFIKK
jgi:hypothetical protein